jgi:hypothetical protein
MNLTQKTKKIIVISSCSLLSIVLLIWYFVPVLTFYFYCYRDSSLRRMLYVKPVAVKALEKPPKHWTDVTIGELSIALPISEHTKISGKESYIGFTLRKGHLIVNDLAPTKELMQMAKADKLPYPPIPFRDLLAMYNSTPADISIFHTRSRNMTAAANQILKFISIPIMGGLGSVYYVDTQTLKALCVVSEEFEKGYLAYASVYGKNEKSYANLTLHHYRDKAVLETDLFAILGGMRMPDHVNDSGRVEKDIDRIVKQYNKS